MSHAEYAADKLAAPAVGFHDAVRDLRVGLEREFDPDMPWQFVPSRVVRNSAAINGWLQIEGVAWRKVGAEARFGG